MPREFSNTGTLMLILPLSGQDLPASVQLTPRATLKALQMREACGKVWVQIKHTTTAPSGKSVTRVERVVNGVKEVCTDLQSCQQALMEELAMQFSLASALICNGWLREQLGYLANTNTAKSILGGSAIPSDDMDEATLITHASPMNHVDLSASG